MAGGYRIQEPAADLAVAAALISSLGGVPLPVQSVYFGEISLSGATRPVSHGATRLKEAKKLGFGRAILPSGSVNRKKDEAKSIAPEGLELVEISELADLAGRILSQAGGRGAGSGNFARSGRGLILVLVSGICFKIN